MACFHLQTERERLMAEQNEIVHIITRECSQTDSMSVCMCARVCEIYLANTKAISKEMSHARYATPTHARYATPTHARYSTQGMPHPLMQGTPHPLMQGTPHPLMQGMPHPLMQGTPHPLMQVRHTHSALLHWPVMIH